MRYLRSRINFKSNELIDMQRLWMMDAAGYSSKSTMFLLIFSMISFSASGGIHVWTKLLHGGIDIIDTKDEWHHSRCKVQQRIAVESTFVMKELICCHRWNPNLGHGVFRCICGIFVATPRLVHNSSGAMARMLLVDVIFALIDNGLGIDWDQGLLKTMR